MEEELLTRHRVLETDSEGERAAFQSLHGGVHERRVEPGDRPSRYVYNVAALANADLAWSLSSGPASWVSVPSGTRWFILHVALTGVTEYAIRGRSLRLAPGDGILLAPRVPYSLERPAGEVRRLVLRLSAAALRPGVGARGRRGSFSETPLAADAFASLRRTLLFVASELDEPSSSLATSASAQHDALELIRTQLFEAFAVPQRPWPIDEPRRKSGAERLRRVEDWIEANLHGPVTLARLAAVAGIGARTLQQDFQRVHDCTPLAFLRERRLERAQLLLTRPRPETTVTEVAARCGFTHLGRFSVAYRSLFGEAPSETLAGASRQGASERVSRSGGPGPNPREG